jgi:glycosyltransferase involved in cell wall biosynthesis
MRILIFHGYLLAGTGSNVYNARLAEALVRLGHDVHLMSQDRHPERQPFVDAVGDWDEGELRVRVLREPVRCTTYRPDIGGLLPVYVADRYEGIEARPFTDCSDQEVGHYIASNVKAVRELVVRMRPQLALANHLVMGPVILARGLDGVPYAVTIHGSALEYTVKAAPERFLGLAREGVLGARGVLVGSLHTALSLWEALGLKELEQRTRLGPPGVDVARFRPIEQHAGSSQTLLRALAGRVRAHAGASSPAEGSSSFARDDLNAAAALDGLAPGQERLVAFVGKLIVSKGVDLLIAAWPLVLEHAPNARLVVVGFGSYRQGLELLIGALGQGQLERARELAVLGRALELPAGQGLDEAPPSASTWERERAQLGESGQPGTGHLRYLLAFLDGLRGERLQRYLEAAHGLPERTTFTGRLDHEELAELLPVCEAVAVPSTFPESFGMIAVEGAACGVLPVSSAHSGLAEVSSVFAREVPDEARRWLTFALGEHVVEALAHCLVGWLAADPHMRARTRSALVATARERFSWEGVARGVIAAARGELERLESPRGPTSLG